MFKQYPLSELLQTIKKDVSPQHAFVFDCDGTLIDGDVSSLTGWQLMKAGMVDMELIPAQYRNPSFYLSMSLSDYERIRSEIQKLHGATYSFEWELSIQSGIPHQLVVDYAHQGIDHGFKNSLVGFTPVLPNVLKDFLSQSWVVSGSSYPTVSALAAKLGLSHERVLATRLELVDGIYQKSFTPPGFVWEKNKVAALRNAGIDAPYFVAGDTYGDWHMMEIATHWVWCVLSSKGHFSSQYRKFLSEKLPFGQAIPSEAGFYVTEWQRKHWVFEVH